MRQQFESNEVLERAVSALQTNTGLRAELSGVSGARNGHDLRLSIKLNGISSQHLSLIGGVAKNLASTMLIGAARLPPKS